MKAAALVLLASGITAAEAAGCTDSEVQRIILHPKALHELFHCAGGTAVTTGRLSDLVFGLTEHGNVGLTLEAP
jgi:hypothetical protein